MEFLRDSIWQSIGSITGFVTLLVTLIIFRAQAHRKKLSHEIITDSALIGESVKNELSNKIKITYAGKSIQNIRLIVFRIYNSGNSAILASEFETPIKVIFQENCKILNANIVDTLPRGLQPIIEVEKNQINIKPLLLNANDEIVVKALINNYSEGINFTSRIVGIREIESSINTNYLSSLPYNLFAVFGFGGVAGAQAMLFILAFANSIVGVEVPPVAEASFSLALALASALVAFWVMRSTFRDSKRAML